MDSGPTFGAKNQQGEADVEIIDVQDANDVNIEQLVDGDRYDDDYDGNQTEIPDIDKMNSSEGQT